MLSPLPLSDEQPAADRRQTPREPALAARMLGYVYENGESLFRATLVVSLAMLALLWHSANQTLLLAWALAQMGVALGRRHLIRAYFLDPHRNDRVGTWTRRHLVGSAAAGLSWGAGAWLVSADQAIGQQLLVYVTLAGVGTAAAQSNSAVPASVYAVIGPIAAQITLTLLLNPHINGLAAILVILLYLAMLGIITRRQYLSQCDALSLALDKEVLLQNMTRSNQSLADEIFEHQRTEQALVDSNKRFRALFDDMPSIAFAVNQDGRILDANRYGAEQLGFDQVSSLTGSSVYARVPECEQAALRQQLHDAMQDIDTPRREHAALDRDAGQRWVRSIARRLHRNGSGKEVLLLWEDLSENHQLQDQLSWQSAHDALTGLQNRAEFERQLASAGEQARHEGKSHVLCMIDVDQFKLINDACGHLAGNELLRQLALLLQRRTRRGDVLARLSADEFGLLAMDCEIDSIERVAEGHREAIESLGFQWQGQTYHVTASIGLAPIDPGQADVQALLARADAACYVAKDSGGNRIHSYHSTDTEAARRHGEMRWATRIPQALADERLVLFRQVIASVDNSETGEHYEILVRLRDADGSMVPPGVFLPAAERYNLSGRIDEWVVGRTLQWLDAHPQARGQLAMCSINLSGISLNSKQFLQRLESLLNHCATPAEKICFEVTETAAIGNLDQARSFIRRIKEIGCRFALDDFGSGLSSFGYLKNLPVDYLKIDGQFVRDMAKDAIDAAMVRSINDIGHVMGKLTIAEFVEDQAILDALRELGVDYAQGYFLGKPEPLPD